ncbi:MAG: glycoside hydrolase family 3 N-terminal domain-containing protein [Gemmatimonadaceae bacterium]
MRRIATRVARAHAERIAAIQHYFVDATRLGIPIVPFEEMLHGVAREGATLFPQAIALAASWAPTSVRALSEPPNTS